MSGSRLREQQNRETVRKACLVAAREAYERAMRQGLCAEGALESALGAIETLDLDAVDDTSSSTAIKQKETD